MQELLTRNVSEASRVKSDRTNKWLAILLASYIGAKELRIILGVQHKLLLIICLK